MTAEAAHGQTPRGAPSPANQQTAHETQVDSLDPRPVAPDFLNSLSQELTWMLLYSWTDGVPKLFAKHLLDPDDRLVDRLLGG
jgi:hypothetical protein